MSTDISIDNMMQKALEIPGLLSLAAGFTDNHLAPREQVRRISNELLATEENLDILQYGLPIGRRGLRAAMAARLLQQDRALGAEPATIGVEETIITTGSQQAIFLAVQALCQPGDIVLVENPTYFVMLDVLRTLGVRAVALPSRDDTLDVEALPAFFDALRERGELARVRCVYLVSYFSNPSAKSLSFAQKSGLVDAMRDARLLVPVLEDIAYREFYFDEAWPAPSMLCLDSEEIPIIVTGTLTKLFSTGLKVGWLSVRHPAILRRLIDLKRCQDFGTSNFAQAICEQAVEQGILDEYLAWMRPRYKEKCHALHDGLVEAGLKDLGWSWELSTGSLYLWLVAPEGMATGPESELSRTCMDEKVIYVPGTLCCPGALSGRVRLSFGALNPEDLREAAARFARAARRVAQGEGVDA